MFFRILQDRLEKPNSCFSFITLKNCNSLSFLFDLMVIKLLIQQILKFLIPPSPSGCDFKLRALLYRVVCNFFSVTSIQLLQTYIRNYATNSQGSPRCKTNTFPERERDSFSYLQTQPAESDELTSSLLREEL